MTDKPPFVTVIPEESDGAQLRALERGHYVRCDGRDDSGPINEAIQHTQRGRGYSIGPEAWERIFGKRAK